MVVDQRKEEEFNWRNIWQGIQDQAAEFVDQNNKN